MQVGFIKLNTVQWNNLTDDIKESTNLVQFKKV